MTVGIVITANKLTKTTSTNTEKRVYTINPDGSQGIEVYSYASAIYSTPIIVNGPGSTSGGNVQSYLAGSVNNSGVISNGNFSCGYTLSGTGSLIASKLLTTSTIPYTHPNGTCLVTVVDADLYTGAHHLESVSGSVNSNVLTISGVHKIGSGTNSIIYIVGITF